MAQQLAQYTLDKQVTKTLLLLAGEVITRDISTSVGDIILHNKWLNLVRRRNGILIMLIWAHRNSD